MRARYLIVLGLLALLPLGLLTWLGIRVARQEEAREGARARRLLGEQLALVTEMTDGFVDERARELRRRVDETPLETAPLRRLARRDAWLLQVLVQRSDGLVLHPPGPGQRSAAEARFLQRVDHVVEDRLLLHEATAGEEATAGDADTGWHTFHWEDGLTLLFWRRLEDGRVVALELNRARFLADLIVRLPTERSPGSGRQLVRLRDVDDRVLHQWGDHRPAKGEEALARVALGAPLRTWRLELTSGDLGPAGSGMAWWLLGAGLATVTAVLMGLMLFLWRELARDLREARQRVTFVNQVSHELKTPLTAIRMYAELLEDVLPEDDEQASRYLAVIGSESQRLSRLIHNVLTFARRQRGTYELHPAEGIVDEVVRRTLEPFRPRLEPKGVAIELSLDAGARVRIDADALEQIVANLVGNVEKYALKGGLLEVTSSREGRRCVIEVADRGPGIPADQREAVFRPFHRVSSRLSDGVAGTGIGLSIARDLARLHGGDLITLPVDEGSRFRVTLNTPPVNEEEV
jgi:signal transduction histidine kinase